MPEKIKQPKISLEEAEAGIEQNRRNLEESVNSYALELGKTIQDQQEVANLIAQIKDVLNAVTIDNKSLDELLQGKDQRVADFFDIMVKGGIGRYSSYIEIAEALQQKKKQIDPNAKQEPNPQESTKGQGRQSKNPPVGPEVNTSGSEKQKKIEVEAMQLEPEEIDDSLDVMNPWQEVIHNRAESLKRELANRSRLPAEQVTAARNFLTQEVDSLVNKLCLDWFALNEPSLLDEKGLSGNISNDRKVEVALQNKALDAIRKNAAGAYGAQQEDLEQLENISGVLKKIQSEAPSLEDKHTILYLVDEGYKQSGNSDDSLKILRRALAENISGKNLEEEKFRTTSGFDLSMKDLEQQEVMLGSKENYINAKPVAEIKKEIEDQQKNTAMGGRRRNTTITSEEADRLIAERKKDCLKKIGRDLSEQDIVALRVAKFDVHDFKRVGFWKWKRIQDGDGKKYKTAQFDELVKKAQEGFTVKVEEQLKQKLGVVGLEWDGKKAALEQLKGEIQAKVETAVTSLAKSPDLQVGGIEANYERIKEELLDGLIEDLAQEDPKTEKQLENIKKQFEGQEQKASELFRDAFERKGKFAGLSGDIVKDREKLISALGSYGFDLPTTTSFVDNWGKTYNRDFKKKRSWWRRLLGIGQEASVTKKKKAT